MSSNWTALLIANALAVLLVIRLLSLRLHRVYYVFSAYVAFQIVASGVVWCARYFGHRLDYRLLWLGIMTVSWALTIATVYVLLDAVLSNLPGILRFSRMVLNAAFVTGAVIALISVHSNSFTTADLLTLDGAVDFAFILERIVAILAGVAALCTVLFVLWFPVEMPRNLARFIVGLVVYLSVRAATLVYWSHTGQNWVSASMVSTYVLASCYVYWLLTIRPEGEINTVTLGQRWHGSKDSAILVTQLQSMNALLWKSARR